MSGTLLPYLLLLGAIVSEVAATSALKASYGLTRLQPTLLMIVGYCIAFVLLGLSLKTLPVGLAYAIWAGLGVIGAVLVGLFVFGESLSWPQYGGIALIVFGVILLKGTGTT